MKEKTQSDLRYIKTEHLIQETFRNMLLEMDYSQITIRELTERAKIHRKTFYLHYGSLNELLEKLQTELYNEILQSISKIKLFQVLDVLVEELFQFVIHTDPINIKILNSQGNFPPGKSPKDYAREKLRNSCMKDTKFSGYDKLEIRIIDAYLAGSFSHICSQWLEDGQQIPLERIVQLTTQLISEGIHICEKR